MLVAIIHPFPYEAGHLIINIKGPDGRQKSSLAFHISLPVSFILYHTSPFSTKNFSLWKEQIFYDIIYSNKRKERRILWP